MRSFTFWKNLFSFYELPVLPDSQRPCKSKTFFGSRLSSRGLGLDYLDCYGDPQELPFGDEGLDLLYLTKAYTTAFGAPSEEILLLKNGVQIPPDRIIDISPLSCW